MKILLDRGHYTGMSAGFDPGAISRDGSLHEAAIVHVLGWEVAQIMMRRFADTEVYLFEPTRSLWDRVQASHNLSADVIVSLHMNAADDPTAKGTEVLCYSERTLKMAHELSEELSLYLGTRDRGGKVRPDLFILRETKAPAYIFELGFISNRLDTERVIEFGVPAVVNALGLLRAYHMNLRTKGEITQ